MQRASFPERVSIAMSISVDPITFEIVRHRLFRVVEEAILTLKHVSGSPITNEAHDLMRPTAAS